jgi:hypothetical protein
MKLRFACKAAFLLVVALIVAVMVAAPASADESYCDEWTCPPPPCDEWTCPAPPPDNDGGDNDGNRHHNNPDNNNVVPAITQDFDQEAESGDVDQSFDVSNTGDNSNQTVGIQGVANTGNAQNQIGIIQSGSDADDFEFDDVGSSIEVSPTNTTSSDQDVDQAASASD